MFCRCFQQNELYETTTISGFGFINLSSSKLEVTFWYIIIFSFASITIIGLHGSVQNYLSNPTVTSVIIASAEDDDMRTPYIFMNVPFCEFNNSLYSDNPMNYIKYAADNTVSVLSKQDYLFHNVSAETILNYWFLIEEYDDNSEKYIFGNESCNYYIDEYEDPATNMTPHEECIMNQNKHEEKLDTLKLKLEKQHKIMGMKPNREDIFLNIILRLYTLQDSFDQELEQLQKELVIFSNLYILGPEFANIFNAKQYFIDQVMGGPHVGKELFEAAKAMNKTMADILETCNKYLKFLYELRYWKGTAEYMTNTTYNGSRKLVLQGIRLLSTPVQLEFKFFPLELNNAPKWKESNVITRLWIKSRYIEKMTEHLKNQEIQEFKRMYKEYGYFVHVKDPDNTDKLVSRQTSPSPDQVMRPYSRTALNYVIAGKHVQHFNNSCNEKERLKRCLADCKTRLFAQFCNCVPWGLTTDYQLNQICENASRCIKTKIGNKFDQCNTFCSFCERTVWRSDIARSDLEHDVPGVMITWTHIKRNTIYPMFQENYKYTTGTFLAELGGQMDLWIGCSVIGILHIIIFMCKQIYRNIQHWRKNYKVMSDVQLIHFVESRVPAPEVFTKSSMGHKRMADTEMKISQMTSAIKAMKNTRSDPDVQTETKQTLTTNIKTQTIGNDKKNQGLYRKKTNYHDKQIGELKMQISKVESDLEKMKSDLKSITEMLQEMKK